MEAEHRHEQAQKGYIAHQTGSSLDGRRYGTLIVAPEWERKALEAPVYTGAQMDIQNPDGSFRWMAGIDTWADWGVSEDTSLPTMDQP